MEQSKQVDSIPLTLSFLCFNGIFYYFCATICVNVRWCNGSTADFGSACLGSNPGRTTKRKAQKHSWCSCVTWGKEQEWRGLTVPFIIGTMMITEELVKNLIEEHIAGTSNFLVHLSISAQGNITVEMDGDEGFTIADCVSLSRHIEHQLDRETNDFSLEVASCGVGNPLVLPRQYRKNTGRLLEVQLADGVVLKGRIILADEEGIDLVIVPEKRKKGAPKPAETQQQRILYTAIGKAVIQIEF